MTPVEKKLLTYFVKDMHFTKEEENQILNQSVVIENDPDPVGFHTTIKMPYLEKIDDAIRWGKAVGKTSKNIDVGFVIYKYNNNLVLEGYTYDDDYPHDETDYSIQIIKDEQISYTDDNPKAKLEKRCIIKRFLSGRDGKS